METKIGIITLSDKEHCLSCGKTNCPSCGFDGFEIKDVKEFIKLLKEEMNVFVWDVANEEGGSNLHYNELIDEIIDKLAGDKLI